MKGSVRHLNPDGLHRSAAFSQAVVVTGNVKTVYVGGQNAVDASGNVVGRGDIGAQTERALGNLETALTAGGARLEHVVKWNICIVQGQPLLAGFEAFRRLWGGPARPSRRHGAHRRWAGRSGVPRGNRRDRGRSPGVSAGRARA
jgi:enamine deaminase RidA (YjgF/YER057c/UK114 family)